MKRRGVPEARRAAVAEQHLVTVGQAEERAKSVTNLADFDRTVD